MHKKFLAFCLPILGSAVIVGAGFSAWAFNGTTSGSSTINGTIDITGLVHGLTATILCDNGSTDTDSYQIETLSSSDSSTSYLTLELDQGHLYDNTITEGITPYYENGDTKFEIKNIFIELTYEDDSNLQGMIDDYNLSLKFTYFGYASEAPGSSVSDDNLESYANLTDTTVDSIVNARDIESGTAGITGTYDYSDTTSVSSDYTLHTTSKVDNSTLVAFSSSALPFVWTYLATEGDGSTASPYTGKPTTVEAYDAMVSALTGTDGDNTFSLLLNVTAEWAERA